MERIIVVDGASSSGRTSLADRFAQVASCPAFHIDDFIGELPAATWNRCSGTDAGWAEIGMLFNAFLLEQARTHGPVVADCFYKLDYARDHLFALFGRERVFFVQLFCELPELERRERARGDRRMGLARSQFDAVYAFTGFDLRLDSTDTSIDECAAALARAI